MRKFYINRTKAIHPFQKAGAFLLQAWKKHKKRFFLLAIPVALAAAGVNFYLSPGPVIVLQYPRDGQPVTGDQLYIKGKVTPFFSEVKVAGKVAEKNGDGTFTIVVPVKFGQNTLKMETGFLGKKASYLQVVERVRTNEEEIAYKKQLEDEETAKNQEVLGMDQKVTDLISVYNSGAQINTVKVNSHSVEKTKAFTAVVGEVINNTIDDVYWVKVTATFYDATNNVMDTKIGFAAAKEDVIHPGKVAEFRVQSTTAKYAYYKLAVEWKTNTVTDSAEASAAAKIVER